MFININIIIIVMIFIISIIMARSFHSHFIGTCQYELDYASKTQVRDVMSLVFDLT